MKKIIVIIIVILVLIGGCMVGCSILSKKGMAGMFNTAKESILNKTDTEANRATKQKTNSQGKNSSDVALTVDVPKDFAVEKCVVNSQEKTVCSKVKQPSQVQLTYGDLAQQLYEFSRIGVKSIVSDILKYGVPPDMHKDPKTGRTALLEAVEQQHVDIVVMLLRAGANVNQADNDGVTPLMLAAYVSNAQLVNMLLKAGAKVNIACRDGVSALMLAVGKGNVQSVSLLLSAGADLYVNVEGGRVSALRIANKMYQQDPTPQRQQIIEMLNSKTSTNRR